MIFRIFLFTIWISIDCHAFTCEESVLGLTVYKECPGHFDDLDAKFCCGPKNRRHCCSDQIKMDNDNNQIIAKRHIVERSANVTEPSVNPQIAVTQEGLRDDVNKLKTKVKEKINGTVTDAKTKVKQKVKDKVQKKIEEKLDPTGGHMKLPAIIGTIIGIIALLLILCIVCCCCCPFCILYRRRQNNSQHPTPGEVQMQPLTNIEREYTSLPADDENPSSTSNK